MKTQALIILTARLVITMMTIKVFVFPVSPSPVAAALITTAPQIPAVPTPRAPSVVMVGSMILSMINVDRRLILAALGITNMIPMQVDVLDWLTLVPWVPDIHGSLASAN